MNIKAGTTIARIRDSKYRPTGIKGNDAPNARGIAE